MSELRRVLLRSVWKEVHQRLRPIKYAWDSPDYDKLTFLKQASDSFEQHHAKETKFNGKLQCEPRLQQNVTNCASENKDKDFTT